MFKAVLDNIEFINLPKINMINYHNFEYMSFVSHDKKGTEHSSGEANGVNIVLSPSEMGFSLKDKNLFPMGANSFN